MTKIHELTHKVHNPDFGILMIRLALGAVFLNSAILKLSNIEAVIGFFGMIGFAPWLAYFVSYVEFIAGICFVLGIFTRYAAVFTAVFMIVATKLVFANGFSLANGGYEYTFVLCLASVALITFGSGRYSLAKCLHKIKSSNK